MTNMAPLREPQAGPQAKQKPREVREELQAMALGLLLADRLPASIPPAHCPSRSEHKRCSSIPVAYHELPRSKEA